MSVTIKSPEEIEKMRVAGRLAAEVLDFITPHVRPNVTTDELDALCHDSMVNRQPTIPAPRSSAPPGSRRTHTCSGRARPRSSTGLNPATFIPHLPGVSFVSFCEECATKD